MKLMRLVPAILLAAAGVGAVAWWVQYETTAALRAEIGLLRDEQRELAALRAENLRLKSAQPSAADLDRLRADHAAVDRMRAELAALKATVEQREAALAAQGRPAKDEPFTNAGKATPMSAAQTVRWAINGGAPGVLAETITLTPQGRTLAQAAFDKLPEAQRARYRSADLMVAELLCATTPINPTDVILAREEIAGARGVPVDLVDRGDLRTIHTRTEVADHSVRDGYQVYQQSPEGWRWVVTPSLVMKRLVETGLMAPPR